MTTNVKFHEDCEDDILNWLISVPDQEGYRSLFLDLYLEHLIELLRASGGDDVKLTRLGAQRMRGIEPPLYVWRYTDDLLVKFAVRMIGTTRTSRAMRFVPNWIRSWRSKTECRITVLRLLP